MRLVIALLFSTAALVYSQSPHQYQSQHQAAILSDARYLAGDGTFGAAYSQEDGVEFKEESDVNGDRRGSYSYVDPTGQRRTVTYTAGKNGFQATGDHIPSAPPPVAPQPEYVPLPQYNPPDYQPPTYSPPPQQYQRQYQPEYEAQPAYKPRPAPQYQHRPQLQPLPQYRLPPELQTIPSYSYQPQPQPQPAPRPPPPQYNAITTPSPRRFYPPGKLSFNRTPDGFSYTFSKS
ncbi:hypothetical protein KM043_002398 [Ampulex compressa]|nr:hypothetical protein KM043_002398 [Ampulex compressa]